jgi:EAL domain-containing protein (putative c-di-GMP-specific phosphodiesterase class I)
MDIDNINNIKENFSYLKTEPIIDYRNGNIFMYEILYKNVIPNNILFSTVNTTLDLYIFSQLFNWYFKYKRFEVPIFSINCFFETYYLHNSHFNKLLHMCKNLYIELTEISNWGNYSYNNINLINVDRVILDDFGINNHSLDKLNIKSFAIKLDRIFLDYSPVFLKEFIDYANSLNIISIFEKIETESELKKVLGAGCFYVQGFINKKIINFN